MNAVLSEQMHFVNALPPVADALAGTVTSDVINVKNFKKVTFAVIKGVGTTGTSTFTVEACDNVTPSNTTAIPFRHRSLAADNTLGALAAATTAGYTNAAGSNLIELIEVDTAELGDTGYGYVRLKAVESANDPVLAGILAILHEPRYAYDQFESAIV